MNDSTCPTCGSIAEKPYTRKRQCKECGSFVYFSKRYPYIYGRNVLNLNEVKLIDFYHTIISLLDIENDESTYKTLFKALLRKWGTTPKPFDVAWSISNSADKFLKFDPGELNTTECRMSKLFDVASAIDLARARFMPYHDNRHTPKDYLQSSLKHSLQKIKLDKAEAVIVYANRCCQSCMVNDGVKLSISEAEKTGVIPYDKCDNELPDTKHTVCVCGYIEANTYDELKEYIY